MSDSNSTNSETIIINPPDSSNIDKNSSNKVHTNKSTASGKNQQEADKDAPTFSAKTPSENTKNQHIDSTHSSKRCSKKVNLKKASKKETIVMYQQTGVYLHYLPGHEDGQRLTEGKLEIFEKTTRAEATQESPKSNSKSKTSIIIQWKISTQQTLNSLVEPVGPTRNRNMSHNSTPGWTVVDEDNSEESENFDFENIEEIVQPNLEQNSQITVSAVSPGISPKKKRRKPLEFNISLSQLKQIRCSGVDVGWRYFVLVLLDNVTLPAFHFHAGGAESFLSVLKNYTVLTEDAVNPCIYNVTLVNNDTLVRSLDELNIFDNPTNNKTNNLKSKFKFQNKTLHKQNFQHFLNDPVRGTLEGLSKFGGFISGILDDQPENRPKNSNYNKNEVFESTENSQSYDYNAFDQFAPDSTDGNVNTFDTSNIKEEYELISAPKNEIEKILNFKNDENSKQIPKQPIDILIFETQFSNDGKINNFDQLLKQVYENGIANDETRREIYPYLLKYRKKDENHEDYKQKYLQLAKDYKILKVQWMTINKTQESRFTEFSNKKCLIGKDLIRTDRHVEEFSVVDSPSMVKLNSVLMCYLMYNFDLGYCQGMSDIASVLVQIMESEVDSFHSFVGFMDVIGSNFEINQYGIKSQLSYLTTLIQFLDPDLCSFLDQKDSINMYFCFRWILIWFKREFYFEDVKKLWEVLLTGLPCKNFQLLIAIGILLNYRDHIIGSDLSFVDILRFVNDLSSKMNVDEILLIADRIYKLLFSLKENGQLPKNVSSILF